MNIQMYSLGQLLIYFNVIIFFFFRHFQPMSSAPDNNFLLSDQDTK